MPESVRGQVRQGAVVEKRVVLRLRPYETFETPPRHVYSAKDIEGLTHSLGNVCHGNDRELNDIALFRHYGRRPVILRTRPRRASLLT